MRAMVLEKVGAPLVLCELPEPSPRFGEIRVRISACGVCRTDLHVYDGELPDVRTPIIPGHEIVGRVDAIGARPTHLEPRQPVVVPWLGPTCGGGAYRLRGAGD